MLAAIIVFMIFFCFYLAGKYGGEYQFKAFSKNNHLNYFLIGAYEFSPMCVLLFILGCLIYVILW